MHQPVDSSDVYVYVVLHNGNVVNVYNDYMDALCYATEEVSGNPMNTYIDSFEHIVYVEGDKGMITISIEKLF